MDGREILKYSQSSVWSAILFVVILRMLFGQNCVVEEKLSRGGDFHDL